MNNFYSEYETARRQQALRHEAEMERIVQNLHGESHDKFDGKRFWYEVLAPGCIAVLTACMLVARRSIALLKRESALR